MFRALMRRVLGGKSNKREAALFMFLICAGWVSWIVYKAGQGVDMSAVTGMVTTITTAAVAGVIGATSLHHLRRPQGDEGEGE